MLEKASGRVYESVREGVEECAIYGSEDAQVIHHVTRVVDTWSKCD
jgi:hypothetical protein